MKYLLLTIALFVMLPSTKAQDDIHGDAEFWFLLLNHYKINDQWSVGNELHIRRTNFMSENKQWIIRPFVDFKPGDMVIYSAGYSYIETNPYGKYPRPITQPEHNFWEQVTVNQKLGKTILSQRYRMEHRYQGDFAIENSGQTVIDGYSFSNRFRYRLTLKKPINEKYFVNIFDELWVSTDRNFRQATYNQNWIYVGIGRNINNGNIQLAYLHQHASSEGIVERHPTLQLTVQYDF